MKRILLPVLVCACLLAGGAFLLHSAAPASRAAGEAGSASAAQRSADDLPVYNLELLGQAGGSLGPFAVAEPYVYAAVGPRLAVLELDGETGSQLVGQTEPLTYTIASLQVQGDYAYAGTWVDMLVVFDVSDPQHPYEAARFRQPALAAGFIVSGTVAYAPVMLSDTLLLDISDPTEPQVVEVLADFPGYSRYDVDGKNLYLAWSDVLSVLDISNPLEPTLVATYTTSAENVQVQGGYAYVQWLEMGWGPTGGFYYGNLRILDVSSLPAISEVFLIEGAGGLVVQLRDMKLLDGKLYGYDITCGHVSSPCSERLHSVDVSNPLSPTLERQILYWIDTYQTWIRRVRVTSQAAYLGVYDELLRFDPASGGLLDSYHSWSGGQVSVENERAYLNPVGDGLLTVDVSHPTQPLVTGVYTTSLISISNPAQIGQLALFGPYAYAKVSPFNFGTWHTEVLDLARPNEIHSLAVMDTLPIDLEAVHRGFLYINDYYDGSTQIRDLIDPQAPQHAGSLPDSALTAFALHGQHLYGRRYASDVITIYDITDPYEPQQVGTLPAAGADGPMAAASGVLYVTYPEEVRTYNLNVPTQPAQTGSLPLEPGTSLKQLLADENRVALALTGYLGSGQVRLFQLVDPSLPPVELASLGLLAGNITGLVLDGDLVYLTDRENGLYVLRLRRDYPGFDRHVYLPSVGAHTWPLPGDYKVAYQVYLQDGGWQPWSADGEDAGLPGSGLRVEGLRVILGENLPAESDIALQGHVQDIGWMDWVYGGDLLGTVGGSLRLEALRMRLINPPEGALLSYQVYVQGLGWQEPVPEGEIAGTTGEFRRIEAVRISLGP